MTPSEDKMKKLLLIASLLLASWTMAQQVEPVRYEVNRWNKEQGFHFQSFDEKGGLVVYETEKTDKQKHSLWNFTCLDTSLYETRSDLIPLPEKLKFVDAGSDSRYAAFLFANENNKKASDTLDFLVVSFDRKENSYKTFWDKWPEKSVPLSVEVADGTMLMALNNRSGNGALYFYDLTSDDRRVVTPSSSSFVLFQTKAFCREHCFVVASKEFENKRFVSTSFLVYSTNGNLQGSYRYENMPRAALGRMVFRFDGGGNLIVIGTLERETGKKVKLEGITDNFDKESIGVVWMRFASGSPDSKVYLFKDMPEIEHALTYHRIKLLNASAVTYTDNAMSQEGDYYYRLYAYYADLDCTSAPANRYYYPNVFELHAYYSPTGVEENEQGVKVYPNPAKNLVTIEAEGMTEVAVYNALGQCVLQKEVSGDQATIDLQNVSEGLYLLRAKTRGGVSSKHIAVER